MEASSILETECSNIASIGEGVAESKLGRKSKCTRKNWLNVWNTDTKPKMIENKQVNVISSSQKCSTYTKRNCAKSVV